MRERERERERKKERQLHPLFGGLCCPLSSGGGGGGAGGLAWTVTPGEPFRFPSAVLESHVRNRVLKWPFVLFAPPDPGPLRGWPVSRGKAILLDCGTRGQLPGATPTGE